MSWLSDFMHPGRGAQAAQDRLQEGAGRARGYQQPFFEAGAGQAGNLQDAIKNLMNPQQFMNQMLEGYEQSPYATQLQDVAQERGQQAASAAGLSGSSPAIQAITQQSGNIAQQDRQNYLQNLMNMYQQGTGLSSGLFGQGAQMGGRMGQQELDLGQQLGGLDQQRHGASAGMFGAGLGELGNLGLNWMTGGFGQGGFGRGAFTPKGGK